MKIILLVENNEDIRNNTAEILKLFNYAVMMAKNGKNGIQKALKFLPN